MPIANVVLTNTFDEWRRTTNEVVTAVNDVLNDGAPTITYRNVTANFMNANNIVASSLSLAGYNVETFIEETRDQANTGRDQANTARTHANAAFAAANAGLVGFAVANASFDQANTGRTHANGAFLTANAAFDAQNVTSVVANAAFGQANTARTHANAAFAVANAAGTSATVLAAFDQANTANVTAAAAFGAQNVTSVVANAAFGQANTARTHANAAFLQANTAYTDANSAQSLAVAAFAKANLAAANAGVELGSAAFNQANTARDAANNRVLRAGDTMTGTLSVPTIEVTSIVNTANAAVLSQTLSDAATINWNVGLGQIATVTLGGNRTFAAPTNLKVGTYILHVIQDGTGGRTITWNSVFKWSAASPPTLSTGANRRDVFSFISDGTNLYGVMIPDVR